MKRFFAILLLTLMLASLTVNAFAATETNTGKITISNATIGKTYTIYKIFDAAIDTSVTPTAISYTYSGELTNAAKEFFTKDEYGYITRNSEGSSLSSEEIAALATLKGSPAADVIKATGDTVEFNALPYGYYYIESTLDTWPHEKSQENTAVSINSAMPNATVIDKNQGPTWFNPEGEPGYPANPTTDTRMLGKWIVADTNQTYNPKVKANSVNFGDTVSFEVAFNATNYYGTDQILTYFLNDTIAPGFNIIKTSLQVYFNDVLKTSDYSVTWDEETEGHVTGFTVAAPWHGDGNSLKYPDSANTIFKVTYNATLLTDADGAVIAGDGNVNTATFDYRKASDTEKPADSSSPDNPPSPDSPYHLSPPENTVTYTYALGLTKIDGKTEARLQGAEFTLARVTGSGETMTETTITAKQAKTAAGTDIPGVYEYSTAAGSVSQFKTDDNGVLVIKGLSDENTYSLTEVKSPNGYNRNPNPVSVSFIRENRANYVTTHTMKNDQTDNDVTTTYPVNVYPILFPNKQGVALPITGGMGTTLFYVIGGGLMFVALLLLITRKRMNSEK